MEDCFKMTKFLCRTKCFLTEEPLNVHPGLYCTTVSFLKEKKKPSTQNFIWQQYDISFLSMNHPV